MVLPYKFQLTSDEQLILNTLDKFKKDEKLLENILEWNRNENYPKYLHKKAGDLGIFAQFFPEEYGGLDSKEHPVSERLKALITINLCEDVPEFFMNWSASFALFGWSVLYAGSDEQKNKYLPSLVSGDKIGAFCLTEPDGGSNSYAFGKTRIEDCSDHFILNGSKTFITNGHYADYFYVFARDSKFDYGDRKGIRTVIVERNDGGISSTKLNDKFGMRASNTATVAFDDVKLSKDRLALGRNNEMESLNVTLDNLVRERMGAIYMSVGIARGVLKRIVPYLSSERPIMRKGGTVYPVSFPEVQEKLRDMICKVEEKQRLVMSLADDIDKNNKLIADEVIYQKIDAPEIAMDVAKNAIQLAGGYGFMNESHLPRLYTAALLLSIGGGTVEIQKNILTKMQKQFLGY